MTNALRCHSCVKFNLYGPLNGAQPAGREERGSPLSVTAKGHVSHRTSYLVLIALIAILVSLMAAVRPAPALATDDDADNHPALNIRKVNEEGDRLAGAVFVVEGSDEQFTTGDNGKVCITQLNGQHLEDRPYLVTEITPPAGYALSSEPSQLVEPDNDGSGHCASPDAIFVNPTATPSEEASEEASESASEEASESASESASEEASESASEEASESASASEDTLGGNPTPGGTVPDTAVGEISQIPATLLSLLFLAALGGMVYVRLARER